MILRAAARRVRLAGHAAVFVPRAAAHRTAGQDDVAELAVAVDKRRLATVVIREAGNVVVVIHQPVRLRAVIASRTAGAVIKIIFERQLFAAAVAEADHARQAVNLPPAVFAQQAVGILVGAHHPVLPAKASAHATAPAGHTDQLALFIIIVTDQTDLVIQPGAEEPVTIVAADHALARAVGQGMQGIIRIPLEEDIVAAGFRDALEQRRGIFLKRRIVPALAADVIHRPAVVLVMFKPVLFTFAVGAQPFRDLREGDVIAGRRAPHQAVLIRLQAAFPEQAPAAAQHAVAGVAAAPVALPAHRQAGRQDEVQLVIPAEKLLSADDIHRASDNPRGRHAGHQRAGATGDTGQLVDAGDFAQQLRERPDFASGPAPAADKPGKQQGKIGDLIEPLGHFRLNGQGLLRVAANNDVVRTGHHLRVAGGAIPDAGGWLAVNGDALRAFGHLLRAVVRTVDGAIGGKRGGFTVDKHVRRAGGDDAFLRHAGCPGIRDAVPGGGRQLPGIIPHGQAGADEQDAHAKTGCAETGNKHGPRQNAPGGGNQATDNRSGNHPGQRTGVADIITYACCFKHNNGP